MDAVPRSGWTTLRSSATPTARSSLVWELRRHVARQIRRFRPEVLVTATYELTYGMAAGQRTLYAVDVTDSLAAGIESLRAHAAYLEGTGRDFDPAELCAGSPPRPGGPSARGTPSRSAGSSRWGCEGRQPTRALMSAAAACTCTRWSRALRCRAGSARPGRSPGSGSRTR